MIKRTLAVLIPGVLLVAGCGAGTTVVERDSATPSPMISTPIAPTEEQESSVVSVPSETTTIGLSPEPSNSAPEVTVTQPSPSSTQTTPVAAPSAPEGTAASAPTSAPSTRTTSGGSWATMEVSVQTAADAPNLTGTSPDFQAFMAERAGVPDSSGCTSEFTILSFHPDGYAAGQEFAPGCGGSQNIWGKQGVQWETLMVMQSVVECADMSNNDIPKGLPDIPCLDDAGNITDW